MHSDIPVVGWGPCGYGRRGGHLSWRCRKCYDVIPVQAASDFLGRGFCGDG